MKEKVQLDAIDRRLLRALQVDASQSHAALADQVGASPASCWRRIRALEQDGVLGRSVRLVDSPACVVVDANELSPHLLRMLQAAGQEAPEVKPILEINPEHALIGRVQEAPDADFVGQPAADIAAVLPASGIRSPNRTGAMPVHRAGEADSAVGTSSVVVLPHVSRRRAALFH